MKQEIPLTKTRATTPRAAAVAGILFSVLLITSPVLIRLSVPANPKTPEPGFPVVGET